MAKISPYGDKGYIGAYRFQWELNSRIRQMHHQPVSIVPGPSSLQTWGPAPGKTENEEQRGTPTSWRQIFSPEKWEEEKESLNQKYVAYPQIYKSNKSFHFLWTE